jgi:hypothetical protein
VVNEPPLPFSKAVSEANRRISEENEQEFVYALDVKRARRQQITPLGTVAKRLATGETQDDSVLILGLEAAPALPAFDLGIDDGPSEPQTCKNGNPPALL